MLIVGRHFDIARNGGKQVAGACRPMGGAKMQAPRIALIVSISVVACAPSAQAHVGRSSSAAASARLADLPNIGSAAFQQDLAATLRRTSVHAGKLANITDQVVDFGMARFCRMTEAEKAQAEALETSTFSTEAAAARALARFRIDCGMAVFASGSADKLRYSVVYNGPPDRSAPAHAEQGAGDGLSIQVLPHYATQSRFIALARRAAQHRER